MQVYAGWKPGPLAVEVLKGSPKSLRKDQGGKEITDVLYEMGSLVQKRKATWHKSWKESREEDLVARAEEIRKQGCKHDRNTSACAWLQTSQKEKSRGGISENLTEGLQEKRRTQEDEVWTKKGSLIEKILLLNPSNDTKTKNLENDFEELVARPKEVGWSKRRRQSESLD